MKKKTDHQRLCDELDKVKIPRQVQVSQQKRLKIGDVFITAEIGIVVGKHKDDWPYEIYGLRPRDYFPSMRYANWGQQGVLKITNVQIPASLRKLIMLGRTHMKGAE